MDVSGNVGIVARVFTREPGETREGVTKSVPVCATLSRTAAGSAAHRMRFESAEAPFLLAQGGDRPTTLIDIWQEMAAPPSCVPAESRTRQADQAPSL